LRLQVNRWAKTGNSSAPVRGIHSNPLITMPLISLNQIDMAFGHVQLLDKILLAIDKGERLCLLGRNGEGKSTLLHIICGTLTPDGGEIVRQDGLRVGLLQQQPHYDAGHTIYQVVAKGLGQVGDVVAHYHGLCEQSHHDHSNNLLIQLEKVQQQLEALDGWTMQQRVETVLTRLQLPADLPVDTLSGGWQRRVAVAVALVQAPDLLLLDEPTNHLDIETIQWLEEVMLDFQGGVLFISHDRAFSQRLATRILHLDRGQLNSYASGYQKYLQTREQELAAEQVQASKFDKFLAQEEVWIRQGIKARRTRNEGRVRALQKLREQHRQRRNQQGSIKVALEQAENSGKIVLQAKNISLQYNDKPLIHQFSTVVLRGDKIGLIGKNGTGKTSLLQMLLKTIKPDSGEVRWGTNLQPMYFDQLRSALNPEETLFDAIGQGRQEVQINGKSKHVMGYLQDFLFSPKRAYSPIKSLSGGERNRLLLAKLFTQPTNLLIMDEPTNDLDIESLELLEELLLEYQGTLLLVSHDRAFLDNVVTSTWVFEGNGQINDYVGGYHDWLRQRPALEAKTAPKTAVKKAEKPRKKGLTYAQEQELKNLPQKIEAIESEIEGLQAKMLAVDFYQQSAEAISAALQTLGDKQKCLADVYARWEELEQQAER